jgi:glycerol-3-phosphate dehydrogenase
MRVAAACLIPAALNFTATSGDSTTTKLPAFLWSFAEFRNTHLLSGSLPADLTSKRTDAGGCGGNPVPGRVESPVMPPSPVIEVRGVLPPRGGALRRLADDRFDLLVIGGGITGAGVALDAASRGLRTALVEADDFASGTSSKSTKLLHGGLRYLEMGDFALVREALLERRLHRRLWPQLTDPTPFVFPIFDGGPSTAKVQLGLTLYDALAGSGGGAERAFPAHRRLTARQTAAAVPGLTTRGLVGGFVYYDAVTDDARLTVEVLKAAAAFGAVPVNHCRATGILRRDGRAVGAAVSCGRTGARIEVAAARVVTAVGAWAGRLGAAAAAGSGGVRPSKGVHVVLPAGRVPIRTAALMPSRDFRRPIFLVPWHGAVLAGTTDTEHRGPPDEVRAEPADVAYILTELNHRLPGLRLGEADVISTFAGLRPLADRGGAGPTTAVSREHVVRTEADGTVGVTGGKLTTWRIMARDVVDAVLAAWPDAPATGPCRTDRIRGVPTAEDGAAAMAAARPEWAAPLRAGRPERRADVAAAGRWEQAETADDFLFRRSPLGLVLPAAEADGLRPVIEATLRAAGDLFCNGSVKFPCESP